MNVSSDLSDLTHWGRATHICVGYLSIIGSDNGLSPGLRQAIIWTNDGILLIRPLGKKLQWNFNRNPNIFIKKMHLKLSSVKWRPFILGPNVLRDCLYTVRLWLIICIRDNKRKKYNLLVGVQQWGRVLEIGTLWYFINDLVCWISSAVLHTLISNIISKVLCKSDNNRQVNIIKYVPDHHMLLY